MTTAAIASGPPAPDPFVARVGERELAFMRRALAAAQDAAGRGEVPVGAVVAVGDELIAVAHNERETASDPTSHALARW